MVTHLSRLMANVGGPKSSRRRLIMSAVQPVLLYGAEVRADTINIEFYRIRIARVQRQAALRVCSAYRTVSALAVLVIAGVIPVKLSAGERKAIYQRKGEIGKDTARTEERSRKYQQWQNSWQKDTRGRWTARLIKQIQPWVERRHGEVDYYLTMFLSGHVDTVCDRMLEGNDYWCCWVYSVSKRVIWTGTRDRSKIRTAR
ncbi:uncharacterized protein LOC124355826 [Homalodisca vitripennis]|uniref:uncharacterized protein LOC124355826 n=1 Tax=Homalodisca vitripennis TaxID=197043 RepID=UPI001EEB0B58|nr:uncharacterized protein LOC124355826 [Homalodisca vitripennis]